MRAKRLTMRLNDGAPFLFSHNRQVLGDDERLSEQKKKRAYAKSAFSADLPNSIW